MLLSPRTKIFFLFLSFFSLSQNNTAASPESEAFAAGAIVTFAIAAGFATYKLVGHRNYKNLSKDLDLHTKAIKNCDSGLKSWMNWAEKNQVPSEILTPELEKLHANRSSLENSVKNYQRDISNAEEIIGKIEYKYKSDKSKKDLYSESKKLQTTINTDQKSLGNLLAHLSRHSEYFVAKPVIDQIKSEFKRERDAVSSQNYSTVQHSYQNSLYADCFPAPSQPTAPMQGEENLSHKLGKISLARFPTSPFFLVLHSTLLNSHSQSFAQNIAKLRQNYCSAYELILNESDQTMHNLCQAYEAILQHPDYQTHVGNYAYSQDIEKQLQQKQALINAKNKKREETARSNKEREELKRAEIATNASLARATAAATQFNHEELARYKNAVQRLQQHIRNLQSQLQLQLQSQYYVVHVQERDAINAQIAALQSIFGQTDSFNITVNMHI